MKIPKLEHIESFVLLGIGGIGMSALARYFLQEGKIVIGYDKSPSPLTENLISEGAKITYEDANSFFNLFHINNENTIVIYTPAIPADLSLRHYFEKAGYSFFKRSQILGAIIGKQGGLAVAGTHGKTTTSSILAHLLRSSTIGCNAFLGGISSNYNTNVWNMGADYTVVEADEYDRSFLTLYPQVAIVTSVEPDHLDIYSDQEDFYATFKTFLSQVHKDGLRVLHYDVPEVKDEVQTIKYHINDEKADVFVKNLIIDKGKFVFDLHLQSNVFKNVIFSYPGYHNLENFLAAVSVANHLGVSESEWRTAASSFRGVKRRFEKITETSQLVYIDDYAHHPGELRALITSLRDFYPNQKITMIFQPHLYSRTKDFMLEFGQALSKVNKLILMDIYPARENPIEGITSSALLDFVQLANEDKKIFAPEEVLNHIQDIEGVLVTAGAGDIDRWVEKIKSKIEESE